MVMPDMTDRPAARPRRERAYVLSFVFRCLLLVAVVGLFWWFEKPIGVLLQNAARIKYGSLDVSVQLSDDSRQVLNTLLSELTATKELTGIQKITVLEDLLKRYERFIETTIITEATGGAARTAYDRIFVQLLDRNVVAARSSLDELYARYPTYWNIDEIRHMVAALPPGPNDAQLRTLYADIAANCAWGADPALLKRMSEAAGDTKAPKRAGCNRPVVTSETTPGSRR